MSNLSPALAVTASKSTAISSTTCTNVFDLNVRRYPEQVVSFVVTFLPGSILHTFGESVQATKC